MNNTAYLTKTGKLSPGRLTQISLKADGSGPIENDEELICDIMTEMVATLFKIFSRLVAKRDKLIA